MGAALALGLAATAVRAGDDKKSEKLNLPLEGVSTAAIMNVPTNDQMQREYPQVALALSLGGNATMTCSVQLDGRLHDCRVDSESPAGFGFGGAALRLAAYFSAKPSTFDGRPVKSLLTIPIHFQLGDQPALPTPPPIPAPTSPEALRLAREVVALDDDAGRLRTQANPFTSQLTAQLVAGGDAVAGERLTDAYRQGLDDAIADEVDQRARLMAAGMTAAQLRATLDYLKTPAGAAFRLSQARIEEPKRSNFWRRVTEAARAHLCDHGGCAAGAAAPAS